MKIGIVGAGIGGLTLAALLREQKHDVHIFERQDAIKEVGAGIGIGRNVIEKLGDHDLAKGIKNIGHLLKTTRMLDEQGEVISEMPFDEKTTNVTVLRQTLVETIASYVSEDMLHFNHEVTAVEGNETMARLHFRQQDSQTFDLVIGADGIHSIVRQTVQPKAKVQYQGYTCFRVLVEDVPEIGQTADEYWGSKGRFGIVPLLDGKAYWFAAINAKENDIEYKRYNKPYLQAYFNQYPEPVRHILDRQPETGILHHDIYDLKPLNTFVYQSRIVLLGDAAHATTPNMGQGAGQAMEDAIVLANVLGEYETLTEALKRYDKLRVKHTAKVIKRSRKIGRIAQKQGGLTIRLRNGIARKLPKWVISRQLRFLYKTKSH
ncbi:MULTISPECIES: FAD-dependent monooxygenase [unclassified Staphylococcus]|uniref:FAD-dependent monooxygenase n=1 Tax=unclassified Staphylococcus TaxID=91994 RepID=UPI0021CEDF99|nr:MULTISPECIES: FAD-dependent monooxygenase [unclassified Staphylococcus]UXR71365.1 FAD-dependent monooxygenase [Staphylococcus sp. IVB6240]UXR73643.1 FAD-dependent monooxygenase [Staphylococcus sp. IVB6238]UXR75960.1 FAD-dependent monooxygenase [Staphylococcus sp. IVB6233]UXR80157.1 FAD-dependent monooxygenase [Staphylococcus sp. IVB6218]